MILDECKSPNHGAMKGPTVLHAVVLLDDKGMHVRRGEDPPFFLGVPRKF